MGGRTKSSDVPTPVWTEKTFEYLGKRASSLGRRMDFRSIREKNSKGVDFECFIGKRELLLGRKGEMSGARMGEGGLSIRSREEENGVTMHVGFGPGAFICE